MEKLNKIQLELKAAKDKKNNFGGFNYRNIECIYTELKPILDKYNCHLKMNSDLLVVGDKTYVKVIGTFVDLENGYTETANSFAAIDFSHKGMSAEQACGAAQTYASKYCINHLFLIDDGSLDADAQEPKDNEETEVKQQVNNKKGMDFNEADRINTVEELEEWYRRTAPLAHSDKQKEALIKVCKRRKDKIINKLSSNVIIVDSSLCYEEPVH